MPSISRPATAVLIFSLAASSAAWAQSESERASSRSFFAETIAQGCGRAVQRLPADLRDVLRERPEWEAKVCSCVRARMTDDARIAPVLSAPANEVRERLASPRFKTYMTARMFSVTMSCLTPEIDSAISTFDPNR